MIDKKLSGLSHSPVIPILIPGVSFTSTDEAIEVAKALKKGSVLILEILMRGDETQQKLAADSIRAIRNHEETNNMSICAGTVNEPSKMQLAHDAGADFMVSADSETNMVAYWRQHHSNVIYAPAGFSPTEVANAFAVTSVVKIFPTNQLADRAQYLQSLTAIYGHKGSLILSYDVTKPENIRDLQHPIVIGIAAAWMTSPALIRNKQWDTITEIAELTVIAATQARNKEFSALDKSIARLCELADVTPAQQKGLLQTPTVQSRASFLGCLFPGISDVTPQESASGQEHAPSPQGQCLVM